MWNKQWVYGLEFRVLDSSLVLFYSEDKNLEVTPHYESV